MQNSFFAFAVLMLAASLLAGCTPQLPALPAPERQAPQATVQLGPRTAALGLTPDLVQLVPGREAVTAIDVPKFDTVTAAARVMRDDELVLGVDIEGDRRAYPVAVLLRHEVINDIVGGVPIAVTWCPLCRGGAVFDRRVRGEILALAPTSRLISNVPVMVDRETGSWWPLLPGEALTGPLTGSVLTPLPAIHTDWVTWRTEFPGSLVLSKDQALGTAAYLTDRTTAERGPDLRSSGLLPADDDVIGLMANGVATAVQLERLKSDRVVAFHLGTLNLVAVGDGTGHTTRIFNSEINGKALEFFHCGDLQFRDVQTQTTWSTVTGVALDGPLAGLRLQPVAFNRSQWSTWYSFFPETAVLAVDEG